LKTKKTKNFLRTPLAGQKKRSPLGIGARHALTRGSATALVPVLACFLAFFLSLPPLPAAFLEPCFRDFEKEKELKRATKEHGTKKKTRNSLSLSFSFLSFSPCPPAPDPNERKRTKKQSLVERPPSRAHPRRPQHRDPPRGQVGPRADDLDRAGGRQVGRSHQRLEDHLRRRGFLFIGFRFRFMREGCCC
jgi:hypothetical protein